MAKKIREDILVALRVIAKQFQDREVYSGIDIKKTINEFYPDAVSLEKKPEKPVKPYKKQV